MGILDIFKRKKRENPDYTKDKEFSDSVNSQTTTTLLSERVRVGNTLQSESKYSFKDEIIHIISLPESELEKNVSDKCDAFNTKSIMKEISLNKGERSNINRGWINLESTYLTSSQLSKGFKISKSFLIDWCKLLKSSLGKSDFESLKLKLTEDTVLKLADYYLATYFGANYDENKRKEIYGYGYLNSLGQALEIDELKNKNVARCIEKSACFNAIVNFLGLDSSLILSDASLTTSEGKVQTRTCILYCKNFKRNISLRS